MAKGNKSKNTVRERVLFCPECKVKSRMRLKLSPKFGYFYGCENWPDCGCVHSAHQDTGKPMGKPADELTRKMRKKAHYAFDKIWKRTDMKRESVYKWLALQLGIPKKKCHISLMDYDQCEGIIELCKRKYGTLERLTPHQNTPKSSPEGA